MDRELLGAIECLRLEAPLKITRGWSDSKGPKTRSFLITGQCLVIILLIAQCWLEYVVKKAKPKSSLLSTRGGLSPKSSRRSLLLMSTIKESKALLSYPLARNLVLRIEASLKNSSELVQFLF